MALDDGSIELDAVHAGIAARRPRVRPISRSTPSSFAGVNDDELVDLIEYGDRVNAEVRFIEYMDVGGATRWTPDARRLAAGYAAER